MLASILLMILATLVCMFAPNTVCSYCRLCANSLAMRAEVAIF